MKNPRRLRLILPFAVVLALATITGVAHAVQQSDPTDASFLSPTSEEDDGAKLLADKLAELRVTVDVRTRSEGALDAVATGGATTLFVTTPELVHPVYLRRFAALPSQVRVVMVAPDRSVLNNARLDVVVRGPRWTAAAPRPGCAAEPATTAGPAAALRWQYEPVHQSQFSCYGGGLVELKPPGFGPTTLVGAADPFRNDRADEHGNRRLAFNLLARTPRVVWLDLHEREPTPTTSRSPLPGAPDRGGEDGRSGEDGSGDGTPGDEPPGAPGDTQGRDGDGDGGRDGESLADSPLARAFPPGMWAALALLALAMIALALASARRLGTPVAEPLPARVRAAETVRGLGGLYRRAGARDASLKTVQSAARNRLIEHFDLPGDTPIDELAARVAAYTAWPEDDIRHLLGGGVEDSDEELVRAATAAQELVRIVTELHNRQHRDEGNPT